MRKRYHTTLTIETLKKIEDLKSYHKFRYSNDLIEFLIDKEWNNRIGEINNEDE